MSRLWAKRVLALVALWFTLCGGGLLAGLDPQAALVAGLILAVAAVWWLAADLGGLAEVHLAGLPAPASWHAEELLGHPARGEDRRLMALQRTLAKTKDSDIQARILHPALVAIVDDRLAVKHGVDRAAEPARARAVLGEELADYLDRSPPSAPDPGYLADLLTRIEHL